MAKILRARGLSQQVCRKEGMWESGAPQKVSSSRTFVVEEGVFGCRMLCAGAFVASIVGSLLLSYRMGALRGVLTWQALYPSPPDLPSLPPVMPSAR